MFVERTKCRGYFGIGTYNPKRELNTGTLYRTAFNFGASHSFTIGSRYKRTRGDTCAHYKHIPCHYYETWEEFIKCKPKECVIVGVELDVKARTLTNFVHPERAIYLLGAEDFGIPVNIRDQCDVLVKIPSKTLESMNVSCAGSIIMFHRLMTRNEI